MYEGSPARLVLGGVLIAALAAGLAWTLWGMRADSRAAPATSPSVAPTMPPSASPSASPSPSSAPVGPATGDYAELATSAELEHPDTDPHIARWYRRFGPHAPGGGRGKWTNKAELWDALAPSIREEAQTLGGPFVHPTFGGDTGQPAVVAVKWSNATTEGRGDLVELTARRFTDGRVIERNWTVLIATTHHGKGRVAARMEPFDLAVTDYESFDEFNKAASHSQWQWAMEQDVLP